MEVFRCRLLVMCAICALPSVSKLHAQFVTTINVPPGVAPSLVPSDTQLNLFPGAVAGFISAGERSAVSTNVEVNVSGGTVDFLTAYRGSRVNISGGTVSKLGGGSFTAITAGSTVNVSGGTIGDGFVTNSGSQVNLFGGEFRLDGVLIDGLTTVGNSKSFNMPSGTILSGIFADGTPFAFSSFSGDAFSGGLTLNAAQLPAISPSSITTPGNQVPLGVRTGQSLVVAPGGAVGDSFNAGLGSMLQINGGTIGNNLEAVGASVQMSAGSIGDHFDAYNSSNVILSGGSVGTNFQATKGSVVTISGGSVGEDFIAKAGSTVNISGGSIGFSFTAQSGSEVNISGGSIAQVLQTQSGSKATISGYDFRIDGQPISGLGSVGSTKALNLTYPSVLSGTLGDGTPFVLTPLVQDQITDGTLTLRASASLPETPTVFHVPSDPAPLGVRANQTLLLENGGKLPNDFTAGRASKLQVNGGQIGLRGKAVAAEVNIAGGSVGGGFSAYGGSVVNISGGTVDPNFNIYKSTVNVTGNATVSTLGASDGGVVNVSGGLINILQAYAGAGGANVTGGTVGSFYVYGIANLSGGVVHNIYVNDNGKVNISGGDFRLDGVPINGLGTIGNSVVQNVPQRSVLSGVLTDGTPFMYYGEFYAPFTNGALKLTASAIPSVGPLDVTLPGGAIPKGLRAGQTLTVNDGGAVGDYFTASPGSILNVNGGHIGDNMNAAGSHITVTGGSIGNILYAMSGTQIDLNGGKIGDYYRGTTGSEVNISGGTIGSQFELYTGSKANISGGSVGNVFQADTGSTVKLIGGEFLLDGAPISELQAVGNTKPFDLPDGSVLSGTLADGTPFVFSSLDGDKFAKGTLILQAASLPAIAPSSIVSPGDPPPLGVRNGQSLVVGGGTLDDNFEAGPGSHVRINSGHIGRNLEAIGAVVDIAGGSVDPDLNAFAGATVNISGGVVGEFLDAFAGSTVNISGGQVGGQLNAFAGSKVNVTRGVLGSIQLQGGQLNVSGDGSVGGITGTGEANISGGSIGRTEISGGKLNISGATFDGIFYVYQNTIINVSGGEVRSGINLFPNGGIVLNLTGGSLGGDGIAHSGVINISGGSLGSSFQAFGAVTVNISGGTVGDHFIAFGASKINVSGGTVGPSFDALSGAVINISGGEFGNGFDALSGSHVNITGRAFALNGVSMGSSLQFKVPFTITNRNVELSGILLDGTPFSFNLNSSRIVGQDFFDKGAFLIVTFIPEPSTLTLFALALALGACRRKLRS